MITSKELPLYQKELFSLASYIRGVLKDRGIVPLAMFGSCLGALRHKGFIAWDDDFDYGLSAEDYSKALRILSTQCSDLFVWEWTLQEDCPFPMAKIFWKKPLDNIQYCAYVDLYPIDNAPATSLARKVSRILLTALCRCVNRKTIALEKRIHYSFGIDFILKLVTLPVCYLPACILRSLYLKIIQCPKQSDFVWVARGYVWKCLKKICFQSYETVPFEGDCVEVPSCAPVVLTDIYGDWKQLPPENDRVGHCWTEDGQCLSPWPNDSYRDLTKLV